MRMATVVLVERDREMRRLYGTWLTYRQHAVLDCPGIGDRKDGRLRCLLLAGLPCPSCRQADVIVYDPRPREEPDEQEDVKVIRAIRQRYPGTLVLIAGGDEWMPEPLRRLKVEDTGIRSASSNPPDLSAQVSGLEGREDTDCPAFE
ncbi:MAG: hypothetical protein ACE5IQ_04465 [Candidatus Methylomirabilales bacterium]